MTFEYFDAYLAPLIDATPEWETRAAADVANLGTFPTLWSDKLTVLRAYLLCCMESNAQADDVFSVKLKQYQKEFDATLTLARSAVNVIALTPKLPLSVPILRG